MKILVTGGCGFIGSNFLNLLVPKFPVTQFLNVDALTYAGNPFNLVKIQDLPNYQFTKLNLADEGATHQLVQSFHPDIVVHFAAESHVDRSITGPRAFLDSNVIATYNLLEACRKVWGEDVDNKVFHHVSTDEVYGELGESGKFTETTPYAPSSPYSASKAASDHYVRAWHKTYNLPVKITNCSNNYGPFQFPEKLIPVMILNALAGKPLPVYGNGTNVRDWLHVQDHCEAIWEVITRGQVGETYNIGGESEKTNLEVVQSICEIVADETGKDPDQVKNQITFVKDRPGHDFRYAIDIHKIQSTLNWSPKLSFESGLAQTVRWYLNNPQWIESVKSGEYLKWVETHYGMKA